MTSHGTRLWINRNYHQIKHWLFVIIGFTLITFALLSYANSNRLLQKVTTLTQQNKVLSEQNKELNQKNQKYAEDTQKVVLQNRGYIQCLSNIFANYTHNFVPITIDNLESCTIQTDGTSGSAAQGTSGSVSSPSKTPTSSSSSATGPATAPVSSSGSASSPQPAPSTPNKQATFLQRILSDINPLN